MRIRDFDRSGIRLGRSSHSTAKLDDAQQVEHLAPGMVDRYTEWADWTGWADEPADRRPRQGTGTDSADVNHNLAKVRVAGSNPVVRSK
jgi:hypothetical protein